MKNLFLFIATLLSGAVLAQTPPSDSLFNVDQVVTVNLTFGDPTFWNTLTVYYNNGADENLMADVTITDNTGTHTYPQVEIALKGNSTFSHPGNKKSFKIDFNDNIQGQKYHGMTKMHFNNCYKDPTFMREKIFFDFAREQGVLAPRVLYANVYMNGTFWGFYDMVEPVDNNFLDRWVDDNNGNMFKAGDNFGTGTTGAADMSYYGNSQTSYYARYELKTNEGVNDWSDLVALLNVLNNTSNVELAAQYPALWEWEPMLRSLALDNAFSNLDSYINSARNYYIYHDSTTFKWNWIKWDANEAFGSYSGMGAGNLLNLAPNYVASTRPHLSRILGTPALYSDYVAQYCGIMSTFNNAHLDPKINAIRTLIEPHVTADVNKQYTTAQFIANIESDISSGGGPGGGNIYGLKSFIGSRSAYLNGALVCSSVGIADQDAPVDLAVWPVPASGTLQFQLRQNSVITGLTVFDATGRTVSVPYTQNSLDITSLATGTYLLNISTNGQVVVARFVKE